MATMVLEHKVSQLPLVMQREIADYVDFLLYKYRMNSPTKPRAGCMKGVITWISDDFNAPLDDFRSCLS